MKRPAIFTVIIDRPAGATIPVLKHYIEQAIISWAKGSTEDDPMADLKANDVKLIHELE